MKLEKMVVITDGRNSYGSSEIDFMNKFTNEELAFLKKINFEKVKLTLEVEEPILDESERKYLSGVIRPFRDKTKSIIKITKFDEDEYKEFIRININDEIMYFPSFDKGTMYKGMELNKEIRGARAIEQYESNCYKIGDE